MNQVQQETKTELNGLVGILSKDSRVQSVHAMNFPGVTRVFVTVTTLQEVKENPPIPAGMVSGTVFEILYNAPPGMPPSFSEKVYPIKTG